MTAHLAAEPFPDLADHDLLLAYAALTGYLSALVPADVYADGVIRARKAVADRRGVVQPVVLDLNDPYFGGQTLPDALRDYSHVHSTTGVCVKNAHGSFCAATASGVAVESPVVYVPLIGRVT